MKCTECSRSVKPVVAFDIDGTMGDYHGHFLRFAGWWLGERPDFSYNGSTDLAKHLGISLETYRQIKLAYRQGGMKRSMPAMGDIAHATTSLRQAGAEVWITTTRPYLRLDNVDPDTREWLRRHGAQYDGLIYDDDKYGRLVEIVGSGRVVCVLDDLPELLVQAQNNGLPWLQRHTKYNSVFHHRPGVSTLAEATKIMHERVREWFKAKGIRQEEAE